METPFGKELQAVEGHKEKNCTELLLLVVVVGIQQKTCFSLDRRMFDYTCLGLVYGVNPEIN